MDFSKALANVQAYLPHDSEITSIIGLCDLEPLDSWRLWTDNGGHTLIIKNNRRVIAKKDNPTNFKNTKIKDIHFKSTALQISDSSKWAMVSIAKSIEDPNANICYVWFLGKDNKLRLLCFLRNEWVENQMPLSSGIYSLRTIVKHLNVDDYKVIFGSRYIKGTYSGNVIKSWATNWPPSNTLTLDMLLTNRTLLHRILTDCGVLS